MKNGVGENVLEAVIAEPQFVIFQNGISVDAVVSGRTNVVNKSAQSEFRALNAAARDRAAFQDYAAKARFREVSRGQEAVVPRARDYNVELLSHDDYPFRLFRGSGFSRARTQERLQVASLFPGAHLQRPREFTHAVGLRAEQSQLDNFFFREMCL